MKKLITAIILCTFCIYISGCSKDNQNTAWEMQSIQGKGGKVIYCSDKNKEVYPNATIRNIICVLQDSSITITDEDTGEEWIGSCRIIDSTQGNTTVYEVIFDNNQKGNIAKSITKYADHAQENTLIVSCKDYSLNFFENTD